MDESEPSTNGRLILPAVLGLLLYVAAQVYKNKQIHAAAGLPPCNSGWIPFLGCAVEFGKEPLNFIEDMRKKVTSLKEQPAYSL